MPIRPTFEWDASKAELNWAKHGLSFRTAQAIWLDAQRCEPPTIRPGDGEPRSKMLGMIEGRLYTAVFTSRGGAVRLISARRSNASEVQAYARQIDAGPLGPAADDR